MKGGNLHTSLALDEAAAQRGGPGAPQKIVYLTADHLHRRGILKDCSLNYMSMRRSFSAFPSLRGSS